MCTVKPYHILNEGFGLVAVRLPSLSRGNGLGLWHNFRYFYPCLYTGFTQVYYNTSIHTKKKKKNTSGDLGEGYNVELQKNRFIAHNIIRNVHKNYAKGLYRDSELLEDNVSYAGLGSAGS